MTPKGLCRLQRPRVLASISEDGCLCRQAEETLETASFLTKATGIEGRLFHFGVAFK